MYSNRFDLLRPAARDAEAVTASVEDKPLYNFMKKDHPSPVESRLSLRSLKRKTKLRTAADSVRMGVYIMDTRGTIRFYDLVKYFRGSRKLLFNAVVIRWMIAFVVVTQYFQQLHQSYRLFSPRKSPLSASRFHGRNDCCIYLSVIVFGEFQLYWRTRKR